MKHKSNINSGSKYAPPKLGIILKRESLLQQLWNIRSAPMVWLAAPAGYGKTTTMTSYLLERKLKHIWYQFDSSDDDNEAFTFLSNLSVALQVTYPDITPPTTNPKYLDDFNNFALHYFRVIMAEIPEDTVFIFDNFQRITTNSAVAKILELAVSFLPKASQIYFLSRSQPNTSYTKWIASGQMAVLTYDSFKLSKVESRELIELKGLAQQNEKIIDEILEQTEGWISGFILRILSNTTLTTSETTEKLINDQFRIVTKSSLSEKAYQFLLKTSALPKMTAAMAQELTGEIESQKILDNLCYHNRFTYKSNESIVVYQYHALFRQFLVSEARETFSVKQYSENQKKAATILEKNGEIAFAANLHIECADWQALHNLLVKYAQPLLNQGHYKLILSWINLLPNTIFSQSSYAYYFKGLCVCSTDPTLAISYYKNAYNLIAKDKKSIHHIAIACAIIEAVRLQQSDYLQMVPWKTLLVDMLAEHSDLPATLEIKAQTSVYSALLLADASSPELKYWNQRLVETLLKPMPVMLKISMSMLHIGYLVSHLGDQANAQRVIEDSEKHISNNDQAFVDLAGWHSFTASYHYWFSADYKKALHHIERGLQVSKDCGAHLYVGFLYFFGLIITMSEDDTATTERYLSEFSKHIRTHNAFDYALFLYTDACHQWSQERFTEALKTAIRALEKTQQCYHPGVYPYMHFAVAQAAASTGDLKLAMRHIGKARPIYRKIGSHNLAFLSRLLCANFALLRNQKKRSIMLLRGALRLAREHGFLNAPWFGKTQLNQLFLLALDNDIEPKYVRHWILLKDIPPPQLSDNTLANWPWKVKIQTINELRVLVDDEPVEFSGKTPKIQFQMLKLLSQSGPEGLADHVLADALWPTAEGDSAYNSLKTTVWRLRKLIGLEQAVLFGNHRVSLNPKLCWVDAWEVQA